MALAVQELDAEIEHVFGPDSPLAASLTGFSPREGQASMAAAVARAIHNGENLVVEAGTGTGKTLAYLIPALLSGSRVILSTGTKTLQDQLYHRDLPVVTGALGRPAKVVQLKGRSNYLCLHRLHAWRDVENNAESALLLQAIEKWSVATRSGDIVEVDGIPEDSVIWPKVTSTQENCLGNQCEFFDRCHVVAARQAALAADIVVVNHHLLLADLVLKDEGFGELLPGCDAVIIDEAHQFPDIAQGFFNVNISSRRLLDLAGDFRAEAVINMPAAAEPGRMADRLVKAVRDMRLALPSDGSTLMWDAAGNSLSQKLDKVIECLDDMIVWLDDSDEALQSLQRCRERACAAVDTIERISTADESGGLRWLGLSRLGFTLNYTPVEIAAGLQKLLAAQSCAWIFTSATLAIGEDFGHFLMRMGLDETRTLLIPSPFDYPSAGLMYLPDGVPDPSSADFTRAVVDRLLPLIEASQGRAFILFTSHKALREAAAILREQDDFAYPLLVQGEAPRSKLLEQFASLEAPLLLGTSSFWEGVDMRGDSLVLVAIDKLPFASPGDPMLKARLEAISQSGGKPFFDYQLPQAVLGLKQGVGRLIRDTEDYGVVVICDPRLGTKGYGRQFLKSLPPFPVTSDVDRVIGFLADRQGRG